MSDLIVNNNMGHNGIQPEVAYIDRICFHGVGYPFMMGLDTHPMSVLGDKSNNYRINRRLITFIPTFSCPCMLLRRTPCRTSTSRVLPAGLRRPSRDTSGDCACMTWTLLGPGGAPTMAVPVDNAPRQAPYMVANAREAHSPYIIVLVDVLP